MLSAPGGPTGDFGIVATTVPTMSFYTSDWAGRLADHPVDSDGVPAAAARRGMPLAFSASATAASLVC
jgi:hypothetical protein